MTSARTRDAVLVGAPALLGFVLCLIQLDGRSLGFDETATVAIASEHGAALRSAIAHDGGNMSGYYVLLHLLMSAFGRGGFVLHLPSAIAAGAAVAVTSVLGLRLFDGRVACGAGLLMAVSLPLVFWGQNARSYAILVALSAGSFLAFAVLLDSSRPHVAWIAYVLCTVLALYASLMAVLIVLAQLLVLAWHRPRRGDAVTAAMGAVAVLSSPLMILISNRGSGQLFWVSHPNLTAVKQVAESVTSAGLEPTIHRTSTTYPLLALTIIVLLAAGVILAQRRRWPALLLLAWIAVPIGFALIESFIGPAIFVPRNLLMVLPAVALLMAWGLTSIGRGGWVLLAALIALRAIQLAPSYGVSPEDWRAGTAFVMRSAGRGDCIAFYPSDGRNGFRYYADGVPPRSVLPAVPWTYERAYIENYATLTKPPTHCRRMWLVSSHEGRSNGPAASRANLVRFKSLRSALTSAYGRPRTREFGYAAPVRVELFAGPGG
jgi:hypothetical protein